MGERIIKVGLDRKTTITDTRTLAEAKAERIAAIKEAAAARILALTPAWKQTNLLARGMELLMRVQMGGAALTDAEKAEIVAGVAVWPPIKAIRDASDVAEAAVNAAKTAAAVDAVAF